MKRALHPIARVLAAALATVALAAMAFALVFFGGIYLKAGAPPLMAQGRELHFGVPSIEWNNVLNTRFPPGTSHAELVAALQSQGFTIKPSPIFADRFLAGYSWGGGFPCWYFLTVEWFVDASGKVEGLNGNYINSCL